MAYSRSVANVKSGMNVKEIPYSSYMAVINTLPSFQYDISEDKNIHEGFTITDLHSGEKHHVKIQEDLGYGDTGSKRDRFVLWTIWTSASMELPKTNNLWMYDLDTKKEELLLKALPQVSDVFTSGRNIIVTNPSGKFILMNIDTKETKDINIVSGDHPFVDMHIEYVNDSVFFVGGMSGGLTANRSIYVYDIISQKTTKLYDIPNIPDGNEIRLEIAPSSKDIIWQEGQHHNGSFFGVQAKYYELKI